MCVFCFQPRSFSSKARSKRLPSRQSLAWLDNVFSIIAAIIPISLGFYAEISRPRKRCEGCGVPSGLPCEGDRALMGLKNVRGKDQPMWCLHFHPEHHYLDAVWSGLEWMGG
jgi:hypothetical protein